MKERRYCTFESHTHGPEARVTGFVLAVPFLLPADTLVAAYAATMESIRQQHLSHARLLVVKLGTQLLTDKDGRLDAPFLATIARQVASLRVGGVPIINENDTISTDELVKITFGDNDILAALVAHALRADVLVLLSVVDGILDSAGASVRLVESVDAARELVRVEKSALGKGGMDSKVNAARMVTDAGSAMVVADGRMEDVLTRIVAGEEVGTLFVPGNRKMSSRSRWIGAARAAGTIVVDAGAVTALVQKNRSLLPAGII